jgi:hypothetical protein
MRPAFWHLGNPMYAYFVETDAHIRVLEYKYQESECVEQILR